MWEEGCSVGKEFVREQNGLLCCEVWETGSGSDERDTRNEIGVLRIWVAQMKMPDSANTDERACDGPLVGR